MFFQSNENYWLTTSVINEKNDSLVTILHHHFTAVPTYVQLTYFWNLSFLHLLGNILEVFLLCLLIVFPFICHIFCSKSLTWALKFKLELSLIPAQAWSWLRPELTKTRSAVRMDCDACFRPPPGQFLPLQSLIYCPVYASFNTFLSSSQICKINIVCMIWKGKSCPGAL